MKHFKPMDQRMLAALEYIHKHEGIPTSKVKDAFPDYRRGPLGDMITTDLHRRYEYILIYNNRCYITQKGEAFLHGYLTGKESRQ